MPMEIQLDVLQDAFDNLADRRKILDKEAKHILVTVERALGIKNAEASRKSV